jgi:hypothetical protein
MTDSRKGLQICLPCRYVASMPVHDLACAAKEGINAPSQTGWCENLVNILIAGGREIPDRRISTEQLVI